MARQEKVANPAPQARSAGRAPAGVSTHVAKPLSTVVADYAGKSDEDDDEEEDEDDVTAASAKPPSGIWSALHKLGSFISK